LRSLHSRLASEALELLCELWICRVNHWLVFVVIACLWCRLVTIEGAAYRVDQAVDLDFVVETEIFQPPGKLCAVFVACEEGVDVIVATTLSQAVDIVNAWRT